MSTSVRKTEKIQTVREESMEVGLEFDICEAVSVVKCDAKLFRSHREADREILVERQQGVLERRTPTRDGVHYRDGRARGVGWGKQWP
jgi:hypothetical protein